jgi:hypothetical protein
VLQRARHIVTTTTLRRDQPNDRYPTLVVREPSLLFERDAQRIDSIAHVRQEQRTEPPRPRRVGVAVLSDDRQRLELGEVLEARRRDHRLRGKGLCHIVVRILHPRCGLEGYPHPCGDPQRRVNQADADRDVGPAQALRVMR